ncbi:MAG TPA: hypothetical protein VGH50_17855 [Candidatus Binatia bacterium]|jgi:hypothetical protein
MVLRDHPLMNYKGIPNWPPRWMPRKDAGGAKIAGEFGVLVEVVVSCNSPHSGNLSQLFLFMEHRGKGYVAAVLFSDPMFCRHVGELMKKHYGRTLEEIGGVDVSRLL